MMQLWHRYFFREIFKNLLFFLLGFFIFYSMIEYATRMDDFIKNDTVQVGDTLQYYLYQFLKRLDFMVPMAFLLASIKVLTSLASHNEWTVLQAAGLSTRKLLAPFFAVAVLLSTIVWVNFEYILPPALHKIDEFRSLHAHGSHRVKRSEKIQLIPLQDGSKLLYQSYLPEKNLFFDVVWIREGREIWRMKYLHADPAHPQAYFIDVLTRAPSGKVEKKASYDTLIPPDLTWDPQASRKALSTFDHKSISELARTVLYKKASPYDMPKVKTSLAFKVVTPLLTPLLFLIFAPSCLIFARYRSHLFLYALSLFSFFAFYMLLDSLTILSDNALLSPYVATILPILLLATFFGWRFIKKTA